MDVLLIVNDAPYGTEKAYNALRLAMTLQREHEGVRVRIFLLADAVTCALPGQSTPQGYYNVERMLRAVVAKGGDVKACGSCAEARGVSKLPLIDGVEISDMSQLTRWVVESGKTLTF
ncbi:MAG: DsrE/DsrF/TusD sulfur relay family protein [Dehalococcoidia bacterium]